MKKAKISKILTLLIVLFLSFFITGCNDTIENKDSITLDLTENFKSYVKSEIPSFTLNFDGTLNTIKNVNKSYYTVFSNNDDIILSNALTELFNEYKDVMYTEIQKTKTSEKREFSYLDENGKVKNEMKVLDDKKSYNCVSYIPLSNGLKLTIDYCMFVSEGVTYYTWCYERSISMYLYYPLMVINNNNEKEIKILTIPNRISLHVSPELSLNNILSKEMYLGDKENSMYSFSYLDDSDMDLNAKKAYVWDYYEAYNISSRSDEFTFDYLNNRYQVKLNEATFNIIWLEKLL